MDGSLGYVGIDNNMTKIHSWYLFLYSEFTLAYDNLFFIDILQVLESMNLVLVVGLSVDYVVHLAEGYRRSLHTDRLGRTRDMLQEVGVSVLSGAITTMGAAAFLLFAEIVFFVQFGLFIFFTITFSIVYALVLFTTFMALAGPQNSTGSIQPLFHKIKSMCCNRKRGIVHISSQHSNNISKI